MRIPWKISTVQQLGWKLSFLALSKILSGRRTLSTPLTAWPLSGLLLDLVCWWVGGFWCSCLCSVLTAHTVKEGKQVGILYVSAIGTWLAPLATYPVCGICRTWCFSSQPCLTSLPVRMSFWLLLCRRKELKRSPSPKQRPRRTNIPSLGSITHFLFLFSTGDIRYLAKIPGRSRENILVVSSEMAVLISAQNLQTLWTLNVSRVMR